MLTTLQYTLTGILRNIFWRHFYEVVMEAKVAAPLRNIEVKARVDCFDELLSCAEALQGAPPAILEQHDSFYEKAFGRLKLRREKRENQLRIQLVHYDRPDLPGAKLSQYRLCEIQTQNAENMHQLLTAALGHKGDVKKTRYLFLIGQTRVHVDKVEGLGNYMELEVVLNPHQTIEEGQEIADDLMKKLGIPKDNLLSGSYMDCLSSLP